MIRRPEVLKITIRDVSRLHRKPRLSKHEKAFLSLFGVEGLMSLHEYNKETDSIIVRYRFDSLK